VTDLIDPRDYDVLRHGPQAARTRAEMHALSYLARFRNPSTRKNYQLALRQFFMWCSEVGIDPLDAKRTHIELFARELEVTGRAIATVAQKLNTLAGFYRFAVADDLIDVDPMTHVVRPTVPRVSSRLGLTRPEFADLLNAADHAPPRDHALICLLGLNGLRVAEVCGIDVDHVTRYQGSLVAKVTRKGGNQQLIPMAPRTAWQVEQTIGDRTTGPVFLTRAGDRMERRAVGRVVARVTLAAGITKHITPHSLRHTFITMALDAGIPERDIAISTGHADTRLITYYDRNRDSIHRNATHGVAAYVQGAL
jgi:site-specific recombinase XerD